MGTRELSMLFGIAAVVVFVVYSVVSLTNENKRLLGEVERLTKNLQLEGLQKRQCEAMLDMQNARIEKLRLDMTKPIQEIKTITKVREVQVKDKSCEAELAGFKALLFTATKKDEE